VGRGGEAGSGDYVAGLAQSMANILEITFPCPPSERPSWARLKPSLTL